MKIACIIPSRYASTRLPGKPLRMIAGQTLIHRVYSRAILAKSPDIVVVATDHRDIAEEVESFGGRVVMTAVNHPTGTDRLAEVAEQLADYDIIVNVQGDEPFIDPDVIDRLAKMLTEHENLDMVTAAAPLKKEEYQDASAVKVVVNQKGVALYFSRALIPYPREDFAMPPLKHIGVYAYRRSFLLTYAETEQTPLEKTESLEQLRALETGHKIGVIRIETEDIGIDTEADLKKANEFFKSSNL